MSAARTEPPFGDEPGAVVLADGRVVIVRDAPDVPEFGARLVAAVLRAAVARRGRATIALSGGSTPRPLYERLARSHRDSVPWEAVIVVYGDDRCVGPDHPASNHRMAREALLAHVPVPDTQVHRVRGELPPPDAAADYDRVVRTALGRGPDDDRRADALDAPLLDLNLLGIGADGHTASLFPESPALGECARWALDVPPPTSVAPALPRVTLSLPVLRSARLALFVVTGAAKRDAVRTALAPPGAPTNPAGRVRGARTWWLLDAAAAAR